MNNRRTWKSKLEDKLYDHPILKGTLTNGFNIIVLIASAFILAIGYKCFLCPTEMINEGIATKFVSGGVTGVSQVLIVVLSFIFPSDVLTLEVQNVMFSVLYFVCNIPIFIIAWRGIGKRFTIYTFINVALVSAFESLLGIWDNGWVDSLARFVNSNGGLLARAIFAGVCTGLSSGLAFKVDGSGGGIDVVAYYIALKKGAMVGRYGLYINCVSLTLFTILSSIRVWTGMEAIADNLGGSMAYLACACYSIFYLMVCTIVIDAIHLRNKKMKIEIVTEKEQLGRVLIANLPHAATIVNGKGVYSGAERYVIKMVVSSYEVNHAVKVIENADPTAFVEVTELKAVYGRFFLPPIK